MIPIGVTSIDNIISVVLSTGMLVAAIIAVTLDNTIPGNTLTSMNSVMGRSIYV